jgi:alanine-glyoxylate transaminase/(R)-3-amino-2-methylpropionate-pyruvate transaminase
MTGIELVRDRRTKDPAKEECARVFEHAKDLGLLIGKGGLYGNVLRFKPPMCIQRPDVDFLIDVLDLALKEL